MNYDPNLFCSGNRAKQEIRVTFALWDYRNTMTIPFYSNIKGLDAIRYAVSQVYDDLPGVGPHELPRIVLTNEAGDQLICDDDEDQGEDWLFDMVVQAEIVSVEPAGKTFDPIPKDQSA